VLFWAASLCLVAGCLFLAVRGIVCTRLTASLPLSCELLHFAFSGRSIQQAEGRRITQMNDFLEPRTLGSQRIRDHLGRSALPRYQRSPYSLALGGRCQKAPTHQQGLPYSECSAYIKLRREPTSGLETPTCSSYERAGRHLYATERLTSRTASSSSPTQVRKPS
jgi:hypothetical protein